MTSDERRAAALSVLSGCKIHKGHHINLRPVSSFISYKQSRDKKHVKGSSWSDCAKKNAYDSRRRAERIIERIKAERGVDLRFYQCPRCGKYHLTKNRTAR